MTLTSDQQTGEQPGPDPTGSTRPSRRALLLLAFLTPVVLVLVAAAGFIHPWNPGSGLAAGEYRRAYRLTQQIEAPELGRCLELTARGTMTAKYSSPAWSLGGPGWTSPTLSGTSVELRTKDACAGAAAPVDGSQVSQFWASETCAEPDRGSWQESTELGRCERDLVAGLKGSSQAGGAGHTADFAGSTDVSWRGTTYADAVCLDGAIGYSVTLGGTVLAGKADDLRLCLDPRTAELA